MCSRIVLDFLNLNSIYDIEKELCKGIKIYRECLKSLRDNRREYNIRTNLAQFLSRAGRNIEALELYKINLLKFPKRWTSFANYGDLLHNFAESSLLSSTLSLHLNICESYITAVENGAPESAVSSIKKNLKINKLIIEEDGYNLTEDIIKENRDEENKEFVQLDEFRKFTLNNFLALNEHSIYCHCSNSKIDDLNIGKRSGSIHFNQESDMGKIDGYVNRIISEFCYSRYLYFSYIKNINTFPDDVTFSSISEDKDLLGYKIEELRSSYRLIYSILDKIMNGVLLLYNLERNSEDYFESFFFNRRNEFDQKRNIHLVAIFSIAVELNLGNGIFKHFKKIRNQMEHDFLPLNNENDSSITLDDLKKFTFELLQLTRAAIFSYVFLLRTETIIEN